MRIKWVSGKMGERRAVRRGGALLPGICGGILVRWAGTVVWKQENRPGGENSVCELMRIAEGVLDYPKVGLRGRAVGWCVCKLRRLLH